MGAREMLWCSFELRVMVCRIRVCFINMFVCLFLSCEWTVSIKLKNPLFKVQRGWDWSRRPWGQRTMTVYVWCEMFASSPVQDTISHKSPSIVPSDRCYRKLKRHNERELEMGLSSISSQVPPLLAFPHLNPSKNQKLVEWWQIKLELPKEDTRSSGIK